MDLKDYYKQLSEKAIFPKTEFIDEIMHRTGKSRTAVYRWLNKVTKPDIANQKILSEITKIPVEELFAEDNSKNEDLIN